MSESQFSKPSNNSISHNFETSQEEIFAVEKIKIGRVCCLHEVAISKKAEASSMFKTGTEKIRTSGIEETSAFSLLRNLKAVNRKVIFLLPLRLRRPQLRSMSGRYRK